MAHEFDTDTLDDIQDRDILNLEIILKKKGRQKKHFETRAEAVAFTAHRLNEILEKLGISLDRAKHDKDYDIDADMEFRGIEVENRVREEEHEWRSGWYVYKNHEIAGFVGHPIYEEEAIKFNGFDVLCTERI